MSYPNIYSYRQRANTQALTRARMALAAMAPMTVRQPDMRRIDPTQGQVYISDDAFDSAAAAMVALGQRIDRLEAMLGKIIPEWYGKGGRNAGYYDEISGWGYQRQGASLYTGGPVDTPIATIPDDALAGVTVPLTIAQGGLQRLQGNRICAVEFYASPGTQNGGQILVVPQRLSVTMTMNGDPVPQLQNVPLSSLLSNADGDRRAGRVNVVVPGFVAIGFELRVRQDLGGAVGETSEVSAILLSGADCA